MFEELTNVHLAKHLFDLQDVQDETGPQWEVARAINMAIEAATTNPKALEYLKAALKEIK